MSDIGSIEELAKIVLPELLVDYFDLMGYEPINGAHHFYYTEKHLPPVAKDAPKVHSKGYYKQAKVQDFPIRGKSVYLYIKRRKWIEVESGKIIKRDWDLVAKGTRMTNEFATFLKGLH